MDIMYDTIIEIFVLWKWWGKIAVRRKKERQMGERRERRRMQIRQKK